MPDESVYDELGELLELPEGASYKEFARKIRRLYTNGQALNWIRVLYERGKYHGAYPALTEYLSGLTSEEEETFFRTGGLQAILPLEERAEKPWDVDPYNGDSEWYREDLHDGIYTSGDPDELPGLAADWLEELARVGYWGIVYRLSNDGYLALPAKQRTSSEVIPQPLRGGGKTALAFVNDGLQVLWFELEAGRSERGHRQIKLNDETLRTDAAIIASLVAMECHPVDLERLREVLSALPHPIKTPFRKQDLFSIQGFPTAGKAVVRARTLDLTMMLLRYHKPYFNKLSEAEQFELLERACGHINEFLSALYRITAFLDYGVPGRQLRSAKGEAEKHIEAAVLKHVYGLSTMEIAKEMGEPIAQKQKNKNDPATVRQWVRLGTQLMKAALGEEGWWEHVEAMKVEAERWNNLTIEEQLAEEALEAYAEARKLPLDWVREEIDADGDPTGLTVLERARLEEAREACQKAEESRTRPKGRSGDTEA
jgi:hypothetical protein